MKIAANKTVFIALGGTGATIIEHLRERMQQRIGTSNLPFLRYIYVDTDQGSLGNISQRHLGDGTYTATNQMTPNSSTLRAIFDPNSDQRIKQRLRINQWFDPYLLSQLNNVSFSMGVAGTRMYSRLAFLASENLEALAQLIIRFQNELKSYKIDGDNTILDVDPPYLDIVPSKISEQIRFVVVASSGGGTGSGSFYDMGYFIRRQAERLGWKDIMISGHMAISSAGVGAAKIERNTAALLTELDHYNGQNWYSVNDITMSDAQEPWRSKDPPYEFIYLLQPTQGATPLHGDPRTAFQRLEWRMAEYLLVNTVCAFDDKTDATAVLMPADGSRGVNARRIDAAGQNPKGPWSYGVYCREWPAAMVHRYLYGRLLSNAAQDWLKPNEKVVRDAIIKVRRDLGLQDEVARANKTSRAVSDDLLFTELTRSVDGFEPGPQLERCKQLAYAEGAFDVKKLEQVAAQLRTCFMQWEGPPMNGNGVVYAIIRSNRERLTEGAESKRNTVSDLILEQCRTNPATALVLADRLQQELRAEIELISTVLPNLITSVAVVPGSLEECWRFANDQYLRLVLESKKTIYSDLLPWLDRLVERLKWFGQYFQEWINALEAQTVKLETTAPSVVLLSAVVAQLESALKDTLVVDLSRLEEEYRDSRGQIREGLLKQLRTLVREGLKEKDPFGNPTLFARDIPKANGLPDFTHLQSVERNLFESISRSKASPYTAQILSLLCDNGSDLPNFMKECEPLLHFKADHDYYSRGNFGMSPNLITRVFQKQQDGSDAIDRLDAAGKTWVSDWGGGDPEIFTSYDLGNHALNTWSVTYWAERSSIQTDLIVGFSRADRLSLFELDAQKTPFTNKTITPPADPMEIRRGRALLMGTIALHVWTFIGRNQGFKWEYKMSGADGYQRLVTATISDDYERATNQLASDKSLMVALERHVSEWLKTNRGAAVDKMQDAVNAIEAERRGTSTAPGAARINTTGGGIDRVDGNLTRYNVLDVRYDQAVDALYKFVTHFDIPVPKAEHPWAHYLAANVPNPSSPGSNTNQEGWYCRQCGQLASHQMPNRAGQCGSCNFPSAFQQGAFVSHADA